MCENNKTESFPMIDVEKFGCRLKMLCTLKQISANDLKEFLNLGSVQAVYLWMEGKRLPSLDNLFALSRFLDVPVDVLLCDDNLLRFSYILQDERLSGQVKRILVYWTGLQKKNSIG